MEPSLLPCLKLHLWRGSEMVAGAPRGWSHGRKFGKESLQGGQVG